MSWLTRKSVFDQFSATSYKTKNVVRSHQGLLNKVCVVGDAGTTVGSGVAHELLRQGATVICPLRLESEVEQLLADCEGAPTERLFPVVVDLSSEAACAGFVEDVLAQHGHIDHGVSCWGHFWQGGQLTDQSLEKFERVMKESASAHFLFVKHVAPALKQSSSSSLLFISQGAGKKMVAPETSLFTVGASAVYGIILAAQEQYTDSPFRVNEMRLYTMLKRHNTLGGTTQFADFFGTKAYSNRKVGKLAADALANSKHAERVVITPAMLDGASVTV